MAAAEGISVGAAEVAVWSKLDSRVKWVEKDAHALLPTSFSKSFIQYCDTRGGDTRLMSPAAPTGSLNWQQKIRLVRFE